VTEHNHAYVRTMPTRFYLASRFIRQPELRTYSRDLAAIGHSVECRWLGEDHDLPEGAPPEMGARLAQDDWEDLKASDAVIVFTGDTTPGRARGGYHVETGLALGWGKPLAIVGKRENVFHWLPWVTYFPTWAECFESIHGRSPVHAEWWEATIRNAG